MQQILFFNEMISPKIILMIYWLALLAAVIGALGMVVSGHIGPAILVLILVPLIARVYCEVLIIVFKMNEALQDIRKK